MERLLADGRILLSIKVHDACGGGESLDDGGGIQQIGVICAGLASIAGTWDKDDHGCEGMPRNRYPPRHMTPRPRLRS